MTRPKVTRRHWIALGIYFLVTAIFTMTMAPERIAAHTPYNHFALLAEAWLHGRLDLGGPPPAYTHNNDFASYNGHTFISFPPFPAVVILPAVALAGSAEKTRDGLFFVSLSGVAPAILFLALEKLSRLGRSRRRQHENIALALIFAFGTVYWFSAVQGTVWFAAHAIGAALATIYLYACIGAEHPLVAGLALGLGFATRTPLAFAFPLFLFEAYRAASKSDAPAVSGYLPRIGRASASYLLEKLTLFALPAVFVVAVLLWHNRVRFGDPFEFGHRYLAIVWRTRMDKWGLFSYHYLGRNLGIVFSSLPYVKGTQAAPFQINTHGLALWVTSPFLAWVLWPKQKGTGFVALVLTALAVATPTLLYQNSGWLQFGYRFSNDFSPFLVAAIAVGGCRLSRPFWALASVAVLVNAFGAISFERDKFGAYYFIDGTQKILYQPD